MREDGIALRRESMKRKWNNDIHLKELNFKSVPGFGKEGKLLYEGGKLMKSVEETRFREDERRRLTGTKFWGKLCFRGKI